MLRNGASLSCSSSTQGAGEVGRAGLLQDRAAAGARLERDHALELEEAQRLPQGAATGLVALEHGPLGQEQVAGLELGGDDVADDALRNQHGRLGRARGPVETRCDLAHVRRHPLDTPDSSALEQRAPSHDEPTVHLHRLSRHNR